MTVRPCWVVLFLTAAQSPDGTVNCLFSVDNPTLGGIGSTSASFYEPYQPLTKVDQWKVTSHWQNLIDRVRTRQRPRCHEDRAFEEAATIVMSVESHKRGRNVKWDPVREEVV